MAAGQLRERITIQTRQSTLDSFGQPVEFWDDSHTVWAEVLSKAGVEPYKAAQFAPEVTHQVTIRFLDGITPLNRIARSTGAILDIMYANYPPRKMEPVVLMCKERVGSTI